MRIPISQMQTQTHTQMRMRLALAIGAGVVAALANPAALPAADDPGPVDSLTQKAQADLEIAVEKLKLKYLIALEKYQNQLAADGDHEAALAVKQEIDRANDSKPSLGEGPGSAGGKITLTAKGAKLGNGTKFIAADGLIKGWSNYGAFATWDLGELADGSYKVTLRYRSGNLGGGILSLKTSRHEAKFSIAGTGSWAEPRSHDLGVIALSAPDQITIVALQGNSREMVYLESITLEPAK